jgi:hypothetical protein
VAADQSWDETYAMPDADLFLAEQQAVTFGQPGAWFQLAIGQRLRVATGCRVFATGRAGHRRGKQLDAMAADQELDDGSAQPTGATLDGVGPALRARASRTP